MKHTQNDVYSVHAKGSTHDALRVESRDWLNELHHAHVHDELRISSAAGH